MSRELYNYKRTAISIAKDFNYGKDVKQSIIDAKTLQEISNIMRNARLRNN